MQSSVINGGEATPIPSGLQMVRRYASHIMLITATVLLIVSHLRSARELGFTARADAVPVGHPDLPVLPGVPLPEPGPAGDSTASVLHRMQHASICSGCVS